MKKFTIQIAPVRKPFMREKMMKLQTVCKYRNGYKYEYSPYAYGKAYCGRVFRYEDTEWTLEEKAPYLASFMERIEKVVSKAKDRYSKFYANFRYEDEIVKVYAPYPDLAPNALKTVYSERAKQKDAQWQYLREITKKMEIQYGHLMSALQSQQWDRANGSLHILNEHMMKLQSMCRPDHHEVVFKGEKNPLTANRK